VQVGYVDVMADVYALCRGVVKTLQDREIKFNHCQRELLARTFYHFLDNLESAFRKDHTKDDSLRMCAKALSELWRVMTYGEMLVAEWVNEDWWKSVICSSVSASLLMHVDFLLQDFIRCLDIAKIAIAEATRDQTFKLPIMDHSEFFAAIVEEAHTTDTQALVRDVATLKEGKTFLQRKFGSSYGLSKYLLRKFQLGSPSSTDARPYYSLDFRCIEMTGNSLGRGSVGTVFECKCFGMPAVVKCFTLPGDDSIRTLEEEVAVFAQLQHANLIHFIGYTAREGQHMLIMERGRENLESYLLRNGAKAATPLNLLKALDILLQIGEGMKYLHKNNVMHGNLKISDIILNATEKKNTYEDNFWCIQVKLADYGLSRLKQSMRPSTATQGEEPEEGHVEMFAKSGDVYSFAMVMYEILMGCKPFEHLLPRDILPKLLTGWRPAFNPNSQCPGYLSAYIQRCWATNPKDRPLFPEICSMLSYCKGVILRHSFPSPLSCINEYDAEILSSRLGSKWCIKEGAKNNLPLEVYCYATFDIAGRIQKDAAKILAGVDEVAEVIKAGRHFGNWTSQACDLNKAFKLFRSVQHHDHPEALWRLGLCYELGLGVAKNELTAISLYEQARDLNFPSTYIELGLCHATGHGVAQSVDLAKSNWSAALQEQTNAGSTLLSIHEMLHYLAAGMSASTLDSENTYRAMASRLQALTSHDIGLLLVHGPDDCNIRLLRRIERIQAKLLKKQQTLATSRDRSTIAKHLRNPLEDTSNCCSTR
jgi:serine/threonine protein kinase